MAKKEKKVKVRLQDYVLPSDDASRKAIAAGVNEVIDSLTRASAENDFVKDVCDRLQEELGVPPEFTKKTAKLLHKRKLIDLEESVEAISTAAELLKSYGLK